MRILGIDPGFAIVGYGIVDYSGSKFRTISYGAVTTCKETVFTDRLNEIYDDLSHVINSHKPECMAIERLYFTTNQKTVIEVAEARGVIMLAAVRQGLSVHEYTPLQVKQSVTGYGKAVKKQVQEMTKKILALESIPKPDDTADALAVAVCHAHSSVSRMLGGNLKR